MAGEGSGKSARGGLVLPVCVGVVGLALIGAGQLISNRHSIESDLTNRSTKALRSSELAEVSVSFSGRDATITGVGPASLGQRAATVVGKVRGVRVVDAEVRNGNAPLSAPAATTPAAPTPAASPTATEAPTPTATPTPTAQPQLVPIGFTLVNGTITVTGTLASTAARTALVAAVSATGHGWRAVDRLTVDPALAAPPPARSRYPALTRLLATAPRTGAKLVIQYDDDWVILRGKPATPAAERALLTAAAGTVSAKSGVRDGLDVPGYR